MDGNEPIKIFGIEIPAAERTPLVEQLVRMIGQLSEENRQLREEIARLKGLPRRPIIRPSAFQDQRPSSLRKKKRRKKRPGSAKRSKTAELAIHETVPLPLEGLPEGTRRNGHEELVELGIDISAGEINAILTEGHEAFHEEKDALLSAAREVSGYFQTDDTGAQVGTLLHHKLYLHQPLVSEDAGQFDIPGFLHGLCWVHTERPLRKLLTFNPRQEQALERVRDDLWKYYRRLVGYREDPTEKEKVRLERDFHELFTRRTGFVELNRILDGIHQKRKELLLVLDYPSIPPHNNGSESDIREFAKRRKISGGTRSDLGRRCRDTFVSLKKTCRKLGLSFLRYLQDRIFGKHEVLPLGDLIRQAGQET